MTDDSETIRPLDQLPPLEFPISTENWAKYHPTVAEYELMVDEYHRITGTDPIQALLPNGPLAPWDWEDDKYEYFYDQNDTS